MKLTYRGISYEYTPAAVETTEGELAGKYRGLDWRFCNVQKQFVQQPTLELKYRGAAYTTGSDAAEVPVLSTTEKARILMLDRQRAQHNRQRSLLHRSAAEIGLAL